MRLSADSTERERFWGAVVGDLSAQRRPSVHYVYRGALSFESASSSCQTLFANSLSPRHDVLRAYAGEWVALSGSSVVAHGGDAADVVRRARLAGVDRPHVVFVETTSAEGTARLGL